MEAQNESKDGEATFVPAMETAANAPFVIYCAEFSNGQVHRTLDKKFEKEFITRNVARLGNPVKYWTEMSDDSNKE